MKAVIERAVLPQRSRRSRRPRSDFRAAAHIRDLTIRTDARSRSSTFAAVEPVPEPRCESSRSSRSRLIDYRDLVRRALAEDVGRGDITTDGDRRPGDSARARSCWPSPPCVIAGLDVAIEAFRQLDPQSRSRFTTRDGTLCEPGTIVAEIRGRAACAADRRAHRAQLHAAALRHRDADAAVRRRRRRPHHRPRHAQDDAAAARAGEVRRARGWRHQPPLRARRRDPDQGQPRAARRRRRAALCSACEPRIGTCRSRSKRRASSKSTRRSRQARTSCCSTTCRRQTSSRRWGSAAAGRKTEISGGVTLARLPELAATGADFVSIGALTHSAPAADLSFEIETG